MTSAGQTELFDNACKRRGVGQRQIWVRSWRVAKSRERAVDACHSYGFSGVRTGPGAKRANNLVNQYLQHYASKGQRAVITASDISESSFEDVKWGDGHGVFTYFLLQGLKGAADLNHDGTVTAGELFAYLKQSVPQATAGKQNPRALVGISSGLTVSTVAKMRARLEIPPAPNSK